MVSAKKSRPNKLPQKNNNLGKIEKPQKHEPKKSIKPKIKHETLNLINEEVPKTEAPIKNKYILPTKYIKENIVESCVDALQQLAAQYKKKNAIFEDETQIFAEIHCIKIQSQRGNIKFVLPHSTVASTSEVCLITTDLKKGRKVDHEPTVDHWEEILRKAGVTEVKTILPLRQLKVEYDQYELKRRLLTQHDFIMVDTRVLNHASHLLGNLFFKKHNMLIPVRINETDIKKNVNVGLRTAMLRLNEGQTSTILIGHTGMPKKQLKENILSLIKQIQSKYPGGEANIRSIALKLPLSLSLPLYITLRPSNTVAPPKLKHKKPKNFAVLEDELTTIPGSKVRVAPDGTVKLVKENSDDMDGEEAAESDNNADTSDSE